MTRRDVLVHCVKRMKRPRATAAGMWGKGTITAAVAVPAIVLAPVSAQAGMSPWGLGQPAITAPLPGDRAVQPLATPMFSGEAAAPLMPLATVGDHGRALDCMAMAIAYEAGNQPLAGQQAVGQVILNRVRVSRFPKSVCGVVFDGSERVAGCQFTFTCDGSIRRRLSDTTMLTARIVAEQVLDGAAPDRVGGATHYHADYVLPYWALTGTPVARIGAHIFYRMPGDSPRLTPASAMAEPEPAMPVPVARPLRHAGRLRAASARIAAMRLAMAGGAATPPGGHSMFAPWGLPVAPAQ